MNRMIENTEPCAYSEAEVPSMGTVTPENLALLKETPLPNRFHNARRRQCTLIMTHRCNLDCLYCYEKHKDNAVMDFDLATKIIESEFLYSEQSDKVDELEIQLFGGEPFLEFQLMKSIMEWCWGKTWNVPYIFSASTNGTLLTEEMKSWLRQHADGFKVVLSCDGMNSSQDINRTNSLRQIDFNFFREVYGDQPVKMTVSPETVGQLADGVIAMIEYGFRVSPSYACGSNWTKEAIEEYLKQLLLLADYFRDNRDKPLIQQLEIPLPVILDNEEPVKRTCGAGWAMSTYDVDGKEYPCHLFTPMVMGSGISGAPLHSNLDLCDDRCRTCPLVRLCRSCYGYNAIENKDVSQRSWAYCQLQQIEIGVCMKFRGDILSDKIKKGEQLTNDELYEAKAILTLSKLPVQDICRRICLRK